MVWMVGKAEEPENKKMIVDVYIYYRDGVMVVERNV